MSSSLLWTASASLSALPASDPFGSAVRWLEGTLLGTVATTVAVICVAVAGIEMLTGRLRIRRGATIVAGCFVLFGAASLASGLRAMAGGSDKRAELVRVAEPLAPSYPSPTPSPYDPYAGASVAR